MVRRLKLSEPVVLRMSHHTTCKQNADAANLLEDSGVSNLLDKTISLRQILKWSIRLFFLAIPLYVAVVLMNSWNLKMGGISLNHSPYKDRIPDKCIPYASRSYGYNNGILDHLLLRARVRRIFVEDAITTSSSAYLVAPDLFIFNPQPNEVGGC